MGKIIMGYWDCPYCDAKGNPGDKRECPHCGHPRDEGVTFYMKDATYVSEEKAKTVSKNPDWYCSYCNTLNSDNDTSCKGCGASKEESEKNYFELQKEKKAKENEAAEEKRRELKARQKAQFKKNRTAFLLGILAVIAGIVLLCLPKKVNVTVTDLSWNRTINIEEYKDVYEDDWTLPAGATLHSTAEEIHHYDQVLDHYEDVPVEKSRQVIDHYEPIYEDLGNGYYEETGSRPVYATEYYTEIESRPVYIDVPVYQTKYYYDIWKWVPERKVETSAHDKNPYWGDTNLTENEREAGTLEAYVVEFSKKKGKPFSYAVNQYIWESFNIGESYTIKKTVSGDSIIDDDGNVLINLD